MLNKSYILAGLAALALAGCTREVYLQPVPCRTGMPKLSVFRRRFRVLSGNCGADRRYHLSGL